MKTRSILLGLMAIALTASAAPAIDVVRTADDTFAGRITEMTPTSITIEVSGLEKEVPVNTVTAVYYDDEPSSLRSVRANVENRSWENALESLGRIDTSSIQRPELLQEIAYLEALCRSRLALKGEGEIKEAGRKMMGFARQFPNSYHFFDANEVIGDLLVALNNHAQAETYYEKLAGAPWPEYQMRGQLAIGMARLNQGKLQEAGTAFDKVLAMQANSPEAQRQKLGAKLGKAKVMAQGEQAEQAIGMIEQIIKQAGAEQVDLYARAYNTLGTIHRKAGRNKDALLAFLHVDTLFSQDANAHARALANLSELWLAEGQPGKAADARQLLQSRYAGTRWARQAGQ